MSEQIKVTVHTVSGNRYVDDSFTREEAFSLKDALGRHMVEVLKLDTIYGIVAIPWSRVEAVIIDGVGTWDDDE